MSAESSGEGYAVEATVFEVWKTYEEIAMHFNQLLIHLRTRALGGVAAIGAVVGLVGKQLNPSTEWGVIFAVLAFLSFAWVALFVLDECYYNRLLEGAVMAIIELEKKTEAGTGPKLNLSHKIEEAVRNEARSEKKASPDRKPLDDLAGRRGRWLFYGLVFLPLIVATAYSGCRAVGAWAQAHAPQAAAAVCSGGHSGEVTA